MAIGTPLKGTAAFGTAVMGASGIVAQVIILRELIVSSFGNELTIGIILANWLLLEGAGSMLGGVACRRAVSPWRATVVLQWVFALFLPVCLLASRAVPGAIVFRQGGGMGLVTLVPVSFLLMLPVSLTHGMLFPLWCRAGVAAEGRSGASTGRVYVLELLGTIAGGTALTFLLVPHVSPVRTVLIVSFLNMAASMAVTSAASSGRKASWPAAAHLPVLALFAFLLLPAPCRELDLRSLRAQWKGHHLVHQENSVHGNLAVTESHGQYTFHHDGNPVLTVPEGDLQYLETLAHIPMLSHPSPERVLVIGGGAGGLIEEVLKHAPKEVHYAELDPLLISLLKRFPSPVTEMELSHPSVTVVNTDGRRYIEEKPDEWDVIIVGIGMPGDLQSNRLFTSEFFTLAGDRMSRDGVLSLALPGSPAYLREELAGLNGSVEAALREAFPHVSVVPGEFNLFLASGLTAAPGPDTLAGRLERRSIRTTVMSPSYLDYILHPRHMAPYRDALEELPLLANTDLRPLAVFWSLSHWNSMFSPAAGRVFSFFGGVSPTAARRFIVPFIVLAPLLLAGLSRKYTGTPVIFAVFTSGLAGMMLDLSMVYIFQVLFGHLYRWLGLLFAAFMGGAAAGARLSDGRPDRPLRRLMSFDLLLMLMLLSVPVSARLFDLVKTAAGYGFASALFTVMPFMAGFLVGGQFPPAVSLHLCSGSESGRSAGIVYSSDLLGGWLGGMAGGVFLLPLLGVGEVLRLAAGLKAASILLLVLSALSGRGSQRSLLHRM